MKTQVTRTIFALAGFQRLAVFAGSLLIVGFLFGQNLFAKWWIIDDHEIMWALGRADRLSISEIVPKLMQTEVGPRWSVPRFRPVYYALRLIEAWAWGKRPQLWYAFRLVIFSAFLLAVWQTIRSRIGFVTAALLTAYTASFAFWGDIVATLGPSEIYATLGLALFIMGFGAIDRAGKSPRGWLLLLIATIVAAGAKENFVILGIADIVVLAYSVVKRSAGRIAWLCTGLSVVWCAWIAAVAVLRVRQSGGDVYGNSISFARRLTAGLQAAGQTDIMPLYGLLSCFLLLWLLFYRRWQAASRASLAGAISAVLLIALYLSQVVFYSGNWPTGTRYDLPGMLCWPIMLFLVLWFVRSLSSPLAAGTSWRRAVGAGTILLGLWAVASNVNGVVLIRRASADNVRRTVHFTDAIQRLSNIAGEHPDYPVVFQSDDPWDFESLLSYPRFLSAYGTNNDMYLLWAPTRRESSDFLESLSTQLSHDSSSGLPGEYLPLSQLNGPPEKCILVVLAGAPARPCEFRVDGQWRGY